MKTGYRSLMVILTLSSFIGLFFIFIPEQIVMQGANDPWGLIMGFVLDENGNPVSNAVVTLWQDGQIWKHTKIVHGTSENPQKSGIFNKDKNPPFSVVSHIFCNFIIRW
jgi:hypothetical protein